MGIGGLIKTLLGSGEKNKREVIRYPPPAPYVKYGGSQNHWKKLKKELDDRLERERKKRETYG